MTHELRVTTNAAYYEAHAHSLELCSPGNPVFAPPEVLATIERFEPDITLKNIVDQQG